MLEVNDWILINAITYKIHAINELQTMQLNIMEQLKFLFDFDGASFYTVIDTKTNEIGNPVGINYSVTDMEKYLKVFKEVDYSKGLMTTGKNIVYRESDIMQDELRIQTEYYQKVYVPHQWHFSLHLNICYQERFLGVMSFFRREGKENFEYPATFVLDMIKDHLAFRMYQEVYRPVDEKKTVRACAIEYQLTASEEKILKLLMDGMEDQAICEQLFITQNTFKKHILNVYRKMDVNKRAQLFNKVKKNNAYEV